MSGPSTSQTNLPVAAFFLGIIAILVFLMFSVWKDGQQVTGKSALQTAGRLQEQRSPAVTASTLPSPDNRLPLLETRASSESRPSPRPGSVGRRIPKRYPRMGTGVFALAPNFEPARAEVGGE